MNNMKIVFMGTPDFAAASLDALIKGGFDVAAVVTQPDKPSGRGHKLTPPPVKVLALDNNIPVYQPNSLKKGEDAQSIYKTLQDINPDVIVVAAYGKLLGQNILDLPKYGCINVHGSLLPKYRGAAPIQWSIINGESKTGITIMKMELGLDSGDMLSKAETEIGENETAASLHDRLAEMGAKLLVTTLPNLDKITPVAQNESEQTYAPMLSREMANIDFSKDAHSVHKLICGLSDWPCAQFTLDGKRIKAYGSEFVDKVYDGEIGEIVDDKNFIIRCGDSKGVKITELQKDGGKRMKLSAFLNGNKIEKGQKAD